jgi:hypothetical protein
MCKLELPVQLRRRVVSIVVVSFAVVGEGVTTDA